MKRVIRIDGETVEPAAGSVIETEPGVWSAIVDGASYEARVAGDEITINGRRFHFEIDDPRRWTRRQGVAGAQGRATVHASMPGKVVRLLVAMDAEVTAGQAVVVVEAMKMQNELKAPRAGRVAKIHVKENDSVTAGTVLLVIE